MYKSIVGVLMLLRLFPLLLRFVCVGLATKKSLKILQTTSFKLSKGYKDYNF